MSEPSKLARKCAKECVLGDGKKPVIREERKLVAMVIDRYLQQARDEENERCAKICDVNAKTQWQFASERCAVDIRAAKGCKYVW